MDPVVICGGGVIGAATAYYLGKRGIASTIVESDAVASGASGAAAGLLTPPLPWDGDPLNELRRAGFAMHADLARELPLESGVDYGYARVPRLVMARSEEEERSGREVADRLAGAGLEARWLSAEEVRTQSGGWIDGAAHGGLLGEPWAQVDPYRFTLALLTAAERMGATIVRSGRVEGVALAAGHVTGVRTGGELLRGDAIVIAMGPWSAEAGAWLGTEIRVEPLKGQIVQVRPPDGWRPCGFTHGGNYGIMKPDGTIWLGTTEERVGFDRAVTGEARDAILDFGIGFASGLRGAELIGQTACLRPLSADGLPIVGRAPGVSNAFVATGHGRQGILLSLPTGRAIADLIADGATSVEGIAAFTPDRRREAGREAGA